MYCTLLIEFVVTIISPNRGSMLNCLCYHPYLVSLNFTSRPCAKRTAGWS